MLVVHPLLNNRLVAVNLKKFSKNGHMILRTPLLRYPRLSSHNLASLSPHHNLASLLLVAHPLLNNHLVMVMVNLSKNPYMLLRNPLPRYPHPSNHSVASHSPHHNLTSLLLVAHPHPDTHLVVVKFIPSHPAQKCPKNPHILLSSPLQIILLHRNRKLMRRCKYPPLSLPQRDHLLPKPRLLFPLNLLSATPLIFTHPQQQHRHQLTS